MNVPVRYDTRRRSVPQARFEQETLIAGRKFQVHSIPARHVPISVLYMYPAGRLTNMGISLIRRSSGRICAVVLAELRYRTNGREEGMNSNQCSFNDFTLHCLADSRIAGIVYVLVSVMTIIHAAVLRALLCV